MNSDYDSEEVEILPVENKILPILHLIFKLTKKPHFFFTKGNIQYEIKLQHIIRYSSFNIK